MNNNLSKFVSNKNHKNVRDEIYRDIKDRSKLATKIRIPNIPGNVRHKGHYRIGDTVGVGILEVGDTTGGGH